MAADSSTLEGVLDFLQTQAKQNDARWTEGVASLNAIRTVLTNEARDRTTQQTQNLNVLQDFTFHLQNISDAFSSFDKVLDPKKISESIVNYSQTLSQVGDNIPVFGKLLNSIGGIAGQFLDFLGPMIGKMGGMIAKLVPKIIPLLTQCLLYTAIKSF